MAIDIGELRGILTLQDQFSDPVNSAAKQLGLFGESFGAVTKFSGLAIGAMSAAGAAIVALGSHGADVADVQSAFEQLSAAAGSSADVMLGELKSATLDTISNFDLMKMANGVLSSGLVTSSADMRTLAAGAKMLADRTGGDTAEAFQTLTSAMASGRTSGLKQLGLFVDTKVATEAYAKALGKSTADLTDHEKATAVSQAALAQLRSQLQANGAAAADFGDNIARGKVLVQNFVDQLSVAIATSPVLKAGMDAMGQALAAAFGGKSTDLVRTLQEWIGKFAIGLTYVGQGAVVAGQVMVTAFYAAKTAIAAIMTVIAGVGTAIVGLVSGLANMATEIPGVGKYVEGFAAGAEELRKGMAGLTVELGRETVEAAKGALGHSEASAALDKMGGVLINVRAAMEAAQGTQVAATQATREFGRATTEAAERSDEASKKIRDANRKLDEDLALIGRVGVDRRIREASIAFDAEVAKIDELKQITIAEHDELLAKAQARYQMEVEAAVAGSDEIRDYMIKTQDEIEAARTTGLDNELIMIEQHRQADIASLAVYAQAYGEQYTAMVDLTNQKYDEMSMKALDSFAQQSGAALGASNSQVAAAQRARDKAVDYFMQLAMSGKASYAQIVGAAMQAAAAEITLEQEKTKEKLANYALVAESAASILRSLFGKSKTAAIAAAILDTFAAVAKTLAAYPWPWSLAPAAAALAAGMAQVAKIRSTGYAHGTPGGAYEEFGRGSMEMLHGKEAVVTPEGSRSVGEDVADVVERRLAAMDVGGGSGILQPVIIAVDGTKLGETVLRLSRTGALRIASRAVLAT